jgi:hypothetical protein
MTQLADLAGTDVALRAAPAPLLPMDTGQAAEMMARYRALCESILTPDDVIGIPGQPGGFVKRSGFSKLATFYGVSTMILGQEIDRDGTDPDWPGKPLRARARVRATATNGRHADGDGACSLTEPRFKNPSGRQKADHDLMATAVTRATNRAISNLIGFGSVSAEEADGADPVPEYPYGEPANDDQQDGMIRALQDLGATGETARKVIKRCGYVPKIVALALMWAAVEATTAKETETVEAVKEAFEATEDAPIEATSDDAARDAEDVPDFGRLYGQPPPETEASTDGDQDT